MRRSAETDRGLAELTRFRAARPFVHSVHERMHREFTLHELLDDGDARFSGGAGDKDYWLRHGHFSFHIYFVGLLPASAEPARP